MLAIPRVYPVVIEVKATDRSAPLLRGLLGELVSVGQPHVTESGTKRLVVSVAARDPATARRRATEAVKGRVVEVGEPSPLQHFTSQKALPYRRSFIFGRYKPGRFNVQGGPAAAAPASSPTSDTSKGVGVGESFAAMLDGNATVEEMLDAVTEATAQQRAARDKRGARWRAQNPALARKMALIAKRTARKRFSKAKGKMKQAQRKAKLHKGKFDPHYESLREDAFKPQGKAQNALWDALVKLSTADLHNGIKMGERTYALADVVRGPTFRGISFGQVQDAASAMAKKKAIVYNAPTTVRMMKVAEEGYNTKDFEPDGRLLKKPNVFGATFRECDKCGKEALIKEGQKTCANCLRKGSKKENVRVNPVDKLVRGYKLASYFHEQFKRFDPEWFTVSRNRLTVVSAVDKVRQTEGHDPADALEDAYMHMAVSARPSLEESVAPVVEFQPHKVRVRFANESDRRRAIRDIGRFTENADCYDDDDDGSQDEAVFTVCGCRNQTQAENMIAGILPRMNLRRNLIVPCNEVALFKTALPGKVNGKTFEQYKLMLKGWGRPEILRLARSVGLSIGPLNDDEVITVLWNHALKLQKTKKRPTPLWTPVSGSGGSWGDDPDTVGMEGSETDVAGGL